jgi:hypothetical protein
MKNIMKKLTASFLLLGILFSGFSSVYAEELNAGTNVGTVTYAIWNNGYCIMNPNPKYGLWEDQMKSISSSLPANEYTFSVYLDLTKSSPIPFGDDPQWFRDPSIYWEHQGYATLAEAVAAAREYAENWINANNGTPYTSAFNASFVLFDPDQTPPTISISSPTNSTYLDEQSPTVSYSVTDNISGVDYKSISATLDGQPISSETTISLYTLSIGSHTLTVSASDNAGNVATQSVTFQVNTSIDSLKGLVSQFTNNGLIENRGISNALTQTLDSGNLQSFVNQVESQSGKQINATVANYLLRDANFLLGQ